MCQGKNPQKDEMQNTSHLLFLMIHFAAELGAGEEKQGGSSHFLKGICTAGEASGLKSELGTTAT